MKACGQVSSRMVRYLQTSKSRTARSKAVVWLHCFLSSSSPLCCTWHSRTLISVSRFVTTSTTTCLTWGACRQRLKSSLLSHVTFSLPMTVHSSPTHWQMYRHCSQDFRHCQTLWSHGQPKEDWDHASVVSTISSCNSHGNGRWYPT